LIANEKRIGIFSEDFGAIELPVILEHPELLRSRIEHIIDTAETRAELVGMLTALIKAREAEASAYDPYNRG